jgi:hypothetical protein
VKLTPKNVITWITENERHVSTAVFVGGFITDLIGYSETSIVRASFIFLGFLIVVFAGTIGAYYTHAHEYAKSTKISAKIMNIGFPLVADFMIGALLSGILIYYAKSASILVSWPFLLFIFGVFFGNELFREYKRHFAFHLVLVFFTLYAYLILALPIALEKLSTGIFIVSGITSAVVFGLLLGILRNLNRKRLADSFRWTVIGCGLILLIVNVSYFTGIIPPLPLTLSELGVYHSIARTNAPDTLYTLTREQKTPWWDSYKEQVVHIVPGSSVSAFSAISAPVAFTSTIEHQWDFYNASTHSWSTRGVIAFRVSGGREKGYRGYSTLTNVAPGTYRITVKTLSGQILGRESLQVVEVPQEPTLEESVR